LYLFSIIFAISTEEINASFRRFGSLVVDWPHKAESKSYFPPKGYAFLLFQVSWSCVRIRASLSQKVIPICFAHCTGGELCSAVD
jgi:hypothetical protein